MILNIFFLLAGIFLLIKGSDIFVDAGVVIARIFKISEILLGLTFVSLGTSLPELLIGINASISGSSEITIGNIIGTNIFNMSVILGVICIISPVKFLRETVKKDIYMSLLTAIILLVVLADTFTGLTINQISRTDAIILLIFFGIFMYYTLYAYEEYVRNKKKEKESETASETQKKSYHLKLKDIDAIVKNIFLMLLGVAMIYFGSEFVVDSTVNIANALNLSQALIAILVIAIGTSLPEISTSVASIKKGKTNIAVGNLIGSNMFNTLFILGTSAIISPIILPMNNLLIDCLIYIGICLIIAVCSRSKFEMSRKEGICLLLIYLGYFIYVMIRL